MVLSNVKTRLKIAYQLYHMRVREANKKAKAAEESKTELPFGLPQDPKDEFLDAEMKND